MNPDLDNFDLKILAALQSDARLTNHELSERINLSASQCSRRRIRLEQEGYITGYRAMIDRDKLGFGLTSVVTVRLSTHNRDNARRFSELVRRLAEVTDAYALTGAMDYVMRVVTRDLKALSAFVNEQLLPHEAVDHVTTAIVLDTLKENGEVPVRRNDR
jgi:DNA-binding Lrp family transcriptional regulator